jgi:type IV pilus assembly protein PilO
VSRRGPLIAGIAAGALALLLIFFLVLPKMSEVSEAKEKLAAAEEQEQELQLQLQQLQAAQAQAPQANKEIREIDNLVPPTIDEGAIFLLLQGAAARAGVDPSSIAPAPPAADEAVGTFNGVPVSMSVTGTYFQLEEFLYNVETLPRAAKVLNISVAPGGDVAPTTTTTTTTTTATSPSLTMQLSLEFYTTDLSAGPGSVPGPSEQTQEAGA